VQLQLLSRRDFIAGVFFIILGAVAAGVAVGYPLGNAMRMGPGYFPTVLGGLLIALGLFIAIASLRVQPAADDAVALERLSLVPMFLVCGGVLIFAFTVESIGLVLATIALVLVSGIAHHDPRWRELLLLGTGLALFAVSVFLYGLGLPFDALPIAYH
jgi:hypothetical protein